MGTAPRRRNVVDETVRIFLIGIVVLHRNLNENAVSFSLAVDDVRVERRFALVQVADKLFDTALVVECFFHYRIRAQIAQNNAQSLGQKCGLAESCF